MELGIVILARCKFHLIENLKIYKIQAIIYLSILITYFYLFQVKTARRFERQPILVNEISYIITNFVS